MRILIYAPDGDENARVVLGSLIAQGHKASLRNSVAFRGWAEPCDKAVVFPHRAEEIVAAFRTAYGADFPVELGGIAIPAPPAMAIPDLVTRQDIASTEDAVTAEITIEEAGEQPAAPRRRRNAG